MAGVPDPAPVTRPKARTTTACTAKEARGTCRRCPLPARPAAAPAAPGPALPGRRPASGGPATPRRAAVPGLGARGRAGRCRVDVRVEEERAPHLAILFLAGSGSPSPRACCRSSRSPSASSAAVRTDLVSIAARAPALVLRPRAHARASAPWGSSRQRPVPASRRRSRAPSARGRDRRRVRRPRVRHVRALRAPAAGVAPEAPGRTKGGSVPGRSSYGAIAALIASPCTGPAHRGAGDLHRTVGQRPPRIPLFSPWDSGWVRSSSWPDRSISSRSRAPGWCGCATASASSWSVRALLLASAEATGRSAIFATGFGLAVLAAVGIARHLVKREGEATAPPRRAARRSRSSRAGDRPRRDLARGRSAASRG